MRRDPTSASDDEPLRWFATLMRKAQRLEGDTSSETDSVYMTGPHRFKWFALSGAVWVASNKCGLKGKIAVRNTETGTISYRRL